MGFMVRYKVSKTLRISHSTQEHINAWVFNQQFSLTSFLMVYLCFMDRCYCCFSPKTCFSWHVFDCFKHHDVLFLNLCHLKQNSEESAEINKLNCFVLSQTTVKARIVFSERAFQILKHKSFISPTTFFLVVGYADGSHCDVE